MSINVREYTPIFFIEPESQDDIRTALQKLKERNTVVLNLSKLETAFAKQAADMMAGCSCAIEGSTTWIGDKTYLYAPNNVLVNVLENHLPEPELEYSYQSEDPFL